LTEISSPKGVREGMIMMRRTWRVGLVGLATAALLSGGALAVAAPVMQAPAGAQLAQELSLARDDERVSHDLYTLFAETTNRTGRSGGSRRPSNDISTASETC
jgi:hypothetical protein